MLTKTLMTFLTLAALAVTPAVAQESTLTLTRRCDADYHPSERIHLRLAIARGTATTEERAAYEAMKAIREACEQEQQRLRQESLQKLDAIRAKNAAELERLARIPKAHAWISTWTDERGVTHRRTTRCLLYRSRTECYTN